jgi:hypothetical protein
MTVGDGGIASSSVAAARRAAGLFVHLGPLSQGERVRARGRQIADGTALANGWTLTPALSQREREFGPAGPSISVPSPRGRGLGRGDGSPHVDQMWGAHAVRACRRGVNDLFHPHPIPLPEGEGVSPCSATIPVPSSPARPRASLHRLRHPERGDASRRIPASRQSPRRAGAALPVRRMSAPQRE